MSFLMTLIHKNMEFFFFFQLFTNVPYREPMVNLESFCYRCSVLKSCLTLGPHEPEHARLPCSSLSPRVCSNSCPLSQWCHPAISSSAALFSFCIQSFPASGSFPMSQLLLESFKTTQNILLVIISGLHSGAIEPVHTASGESILRMLFQFHIQ